MIGHRMPECADLIGRIRPKLARVFQTDALVLITASSGTGLWEAAVRNGVARRALCCVNGAFSQRWQEVTEANGKDHDVLEADWGQPITPEAVAAKLATGAYDTIAVVHNETSTGVTNPIKAIAEAVRQAPNGQEILIMVDSVSGLSGIDLPVDEWDLDIVLTSSQKAFALPPGLAFCSVSERALARAREVPHRGYYFDFLTLQKYMLKNQTPATPAISLLYALDRQLDDMLAEGLPARFARHLAMRDRTLAWAASSGFSPYAQDGYRSATVTCLNNESGLDVSALNSFLRTRGMAISNGYGARLKNKTFRIGHMGDLTLDDLEQLLGAMDAFLELDRQTA
jgi:predicted phosphoserine aminotransferase